MLIKPKKYPSDTQDFVPIPGTFNGKGRGVFATQEVVNLLKQFRCSGEYHQRQIANAIMGLNAGHDHVDNLLEVENPLLVRLNVFYLKLPGCIAEVQSREDLNYYIKRIDMAAEQHAQTVDKTGLYRAVKLSKEWRAKPIGYPKRGLDGDTLNFVITDSQEEADIAADWGAQAVKGAGFAGKLVKQYNLHHTQGTGGITGYLRRKTIRQPLGIKEIRDSAEMLANTMLQARAESQSGGIKKPVAWVSQRGGSAVLTQALALLKLRGISFHGVEHYVYFHEIASDTDLAVMLALDLGFKIEGKPFSKRLWSLTSLAVGGGHRAVNHRIKAEQDYNRRMAAFAHAENSVEPVMELLTPFALGGELGFALVAAARKGYKVVKLGDKVLEDTHRQGYNNLLRKLGLKK